MRAFFVNPAWSRRGVGTALLDGVKLFAARGYREIELISIPVGAQTHIDVVRMEKPVTS